jgi:hypothetical protein
MGQLIPKSANASRSSGEWSDDDCDVLAEGIVVGRVIKPRPPRRWPAWRREMSVRDSRSSRLHVGQRRGGCGFHDAVDNYAFGKHLIIIVTPLAGQAGGRGAFEDELVHVSANGSRLGR